jgi:type II secretory pathway pseudopilin PulG
MLMRNRVGTHGDTLIEVLFAVTVFSLVAVGGLSIMNQGTAVSQRALEITLVRQEINSQAEALRLMNSSLIAIYQDGETFYIKDSPANQWISMELLIKKYANDSVSDFGISAGATTCPIPPANSFFINTRTAEFMKLTSGVGSGYTHPSLLHGLTYKESAYAPAQTFSQIRYDPTNGKPTAEGIWIEAVSYEADEHDDYQKNAGYIDFHIRACWEGPGQSVPLTIGTIVRLYTPVGCDCYTRLP